ncbi:acyl-CoA dehydrogenase [Streptomyces clavifer]|uniref:acyl-CoA dehydrogenase n=1 Tax=Streptomyces clavifer TaxID=68188 RepID=UPI0033BFE428
MPHASAQGLDQHLRSAATGVGPFTPTELARLDRLELFPEDACAVLDAVGLPALYADARHGGALHDHRELVDSLRVVARHDLTVAVAHGKTFLGSAPTWIAGAPDQAARLAEAVTGGAVVSWALTEAGHGSDLLAGGLTAQRENGGWRLDGEKWLINNATRGRLLCVLARTREDGGPRGFSLFLVDKEQLAPDSWRVLPKVPTHGIRGADISGIAFAGARVPDSALVGVEGTGIETVLRTLQLTRTVCAALSLGALDHGLNIAASYASGRNLYDRRLAQLPRVRRILGEAVAALVTAEAVTAVAARSIHTHPEEMAVISAVTKAFVPTLVQDALERLAELLGLRGFLSESYEEGAFAKLERDHRIVAVFDGSTAVNRSLLIDHFALLTRAWNARSTLDTTEDLPEEPVPPFDPARLRLLSMRGCGLVQSLPATVRRLSRSAGVDRLPGDLARMAGDLAAVTESVHAGMAQQERNGRDVPQSAFDLAARYELCFAGAAALRMWQESARTPYDGLSLRASLTTVLGGLGLEVDEACRAAYDGLADRLLDTSGQLPPSPLTGAEQESAQ